ncbi:hypothetical protein BsWGS_27160 [Bradybaena similaris]
MASKPTVRGPKPYVRPEFSPMKPWPSEPEPSEPMFPPSQFNMQSKQWRSVKPPVPKTAGGGSAMPFSESGSQAPMPEVNPDPYVNCPLVPGLNSCTFWPYVKNLDVTLVMYYDPCEADSGIAKIQVRGASVRTERPNHKYVAVDCSTETELCKMQNITTLPSYQLFSRGALVNSFKDIVNLRIVDVQRFVETAPVADEPSPMVCQTKNPEGP